MNFLQGALITALVGYAVNKYLTVNDFTNKLQVELKEIKINKEAVKNSGYTKLYYTVYLVVINPVKLKVDIESVFLNVYFFKSLFGKAATVKKTTLLPMKKTILPVNFEIALNTLPNTIVSSITEAMDNKNFMLNVIGKMNFKEASIDFAFYKEVDF